MRFLSYKKVKNIKQASRRRTLSIEKIISLHMPTQSNLEPTKQLLGALQMVSSVLNPPPPYRSLPLQYNPFSRGVRYLLEEPGAAEPELGFFLYLKT